MFLPRQLLSTSWHIALNCSNYCTDDDFVDIKWLSEKRYFFFVTYVSLILSEFKRNKEGVVAQ